MGRTWRWCRRKPALASLTAALACTALLILVGSPIAITRIERERQRAEREALWNAQNLYAADMSLAFRLLEENHLGQIREILERHIPKQGGTDRRGWEWRYLWQAIRGDQECSLGTLSNVVYAVVISPDGKTVAAGDFDRGFKVWDTQSRDLLATGCLDRGWSVISALSFSADGAQLAIGTVSWNPTVFSNYLTPLPGNDCPSHR